MSKRPRVHRRLSRETRHESAPTSHFEQLELCRPILRALSEEGYQRPTDIQQAAIPKALAGRDVLAAAQTGTGKTAAFALPTLQLLHERHKREAKDRRAVRALVLTPTRELALQIDESFRAYGRHLPLRTTVILGGVSIENQIKALRKTPDIVVATPGRLLDLMGRKGVIDLDQIEILILDEADRMLDMGFVRDVKKIVAQLPRERQTMFFSATMSATIASLASDMLWEPSYVAATPPATVSSNIAQRVLYVERQDKFALLLHLLRLDHTHRTLVFTRTKHRAEVISKRLQAEGINARSIHSNKTQKDRVRALNAFDQGRAEVLVATDIVARGIDVDSISHVINYELPENAESYVHRVGRTARAGAEGVAWSLCDFQEVPVLRSIEQLLGSPLTTVEDHPYHAASISMIGKPSPSGTRRRRIRSSRRRGRR